MARRFACVMQRLIWAAYGIREVLGEVMLMPAIPLPLFMTFLFRDTPHLAHDSALSFEGVSCEKHTEHLHIRVGIT
jgi:hypothetical protein